MRKSVVASSTALIAGLLVLWPLLSLSGDQRQAAAAKQMRSSHRLQIINMDSDFRPKTRPSEGRLQGYDPAVAMVHVGDRIQFVNTDDNVHTATGFAISGQTVPEHYKFAGDPTSATGHIIDTHEWSTGNVRAHGGKSQIFVTKTTGNFYYACAYHLGKGMRAVIVVQP